MSSQLYTGPRGGMVRWADACVLDELGSSASTLRADLCNELHWTYRPEATVLSELLLALYTRAHQARIGEFEKDVLAILQRYIPFDSAWTGRASFVSEWPLPHSSYLDRLPPSFVEDWRTVRHHDPLALGGHGRLGQACVVSTLQPEVSSEFRSFGARHGLAHLVNVASHESHDGLLSFLSLYRHSTTQPFTAKERQLLEDVVPHLNAAMDLNSSRHIARMRDVSSALGAVCDHLGLVHQACSAFREAMRVEWPDWHGQWLPGALVDHLHRYPRTLYLGQRISVRVVEVAGLLQLEAWERSPTDLLSAREFDVLRHYGEGLSYKEVARELNVAPATVRHHLRNVYKKLGVSNKGQLLRALNP